MSEASSAVAGEAVHPARRGLEARKCAIDPVYYMRHYVYVRSQTDEDDDESSSVVRLLDLWPRQEELVYDLLAYLWIIGPKSRKVGFTTVGCNGFGTWTQLFHPHSRVHYFSRRDDAAVDLLARHVFSYERLPSWLRLPVVKRNDHVFSVRGPDGDERVVQAYPTTEDTGIEQVADYTLLDEFAAIPEPRASKVWAGVEPTIAPNGYCLMISRGKGPGGTFATLLRAALARQGGRAA